MGLRLYDSTFFVDLDREKRRGIVGSARQFVDRERPSAFAMSIVTSGELARGFQSRESWATFCLRFVVLPLDQEVLWIAAMQFNELKRAGTPLADNDLWIAATALRGNLELVTENTRHFSRIKGLRVCSFRNVN